MLASVALKLLQVTPPTQAIAVRSLLAAGILLVAALVSRAPVAALPARAWLRAALDALAGLCFAMAVFGLPLALLSAILSTLPLVTMLLSRVTLGEPIGPRRWAALAAGLAGVLCILRPSVVISPSGLVLALVSVLSYAARDTLTRRIPPRTSTISVAFASTAMIGTMTLLLPAERDWLLPPVPEIGLIALTALAFIGANTLIVLAFRRSDVPAIAPLRYTAILWSLLFDALIWGVVPGALAVTGIALIIAAGALLIGSAARRLAPPGE